MNNRNHIKVCKTLESPVINQSVIHNRGISEYFTSNCSPATDFVKYESQDVSARVQTKVYMAHSTTHLYGLVVCDEPRMDKLVAQCNENSPRVHFDDNVELYFDPRHDHKNYYRLTVNPRGSYYETKGVDDQWNSKCVIKTYRNDTAWCIEFVIPLDSYGIQNDDAPKSWGFMVGRYRRADHIEVSNWVPVIETFHEPSHFGDLIFTSSSCSFDEIAYDKLIYGDRSQVIAAINADLPDDAECKCIVTSPSGEICSDQSVALVQGANEVQCEINPERLGVYTAQYAISSKRSGKDVYVASYPLHVAKPLRLSLSENSLDYYKHNKTVPIVAEVDACLASEMCLSLVVHHDQSGGDTFQTFDIPIGQRQHEVEIIADLPGDYQVHAELKFQDNVLDREAIVFSRPGNEPFIMLTGCEIDTNKGELVCLDIPKENRCEFANLVGDVAGNRSKLLIVAHIGTSTLDQLLDLSDYCGVEIYNRAFSSGDQTEKWDKLLDAGKKVWGVAVDDTHILERDAGNGWIMVRSADLSASHILAAIQRGSFYATTGPLIDEIIVQGMQIVVKCAQHSTVKFIGRGATVLSQVVGQEATYSCRCQEGYVRIEVSADQERAWIQPIYVSADCLDSPYDIQGTWYKGNTHAHTNMSDGEHHITDVWQWYEKNGYRFLAITDHH